MENDKKQVLDELINVKQKLVCLFKKTCFIKFMLLTIISLILQDKARKAGFWSKFFNVFIFRIFLS